MRPETLFWKDDSLYLIDQTALPRQQITLKISQAKMVWDAIYSLQVRGAPAIGVAAAYGLCVAVQNDQDLSATDFNQCVAEQAEYLASSRPTAVNLMWALKRMTGFVQALPMSMNGAERYQHMVKEASKIHQEDIALCEGIGKAGESLIKAGMGVLTHCNAGALATTGIGTATAPMYKAHEQQVSFRVFADETRPLQQGSRLTSWELQQAGLDVTLITDNMAAYMMSKGEIDLVIVGSDRVAANGDIANKIGTLSVAINAKHFGIPFYVAFPSSTVDLESPDGNAIEIEQRSADEVRQIAGVATAPDDIQVRNPAFDVTPADLITGLITEKGIIYPPFEPGLRQLIQQGTKS